MAWDGVCGEVWWFDALCGCLCVCVGECDGSMDSNVETQLRRAMEHECITKRKKVNVEVQRKRDGSRGRTMWDGEKDSREEIGWRKSCRRDGHKERLEEKGSEERSSTSDADVEGEWAKKERLKKKRIAIRHAREWHGRKQQFSRSRILSYRGGG